MLSDLADVLQKAYLAVSKLGYPVDSARLPMVVASLC